MRAGLGLFANLRPARLHPALVHLSPLKTDIVSGTDVLFVRELVAGVYFGKPKKLWQDTSGMRKSVDTATYTEAQIERTMRVAFEAAQGLRKMVTMADKQNVMATSRLWREVGAEVARDYPDVKYQAVLADALAMAMLYRPTSYDVIVTDNLFGDILTDEAAVLAGSMGLMPSASFGESLNRLGGRRGLYEPIHGSAPDIAGKGVANPIAAIQSAAMMLRYSLLAEEEASCIMDAVDHVIGQGIFTPDIARSGDKTFSTSDVGDAVARVIENPVKS
jgi:3-isopropylmalate dehydrogenase